MRVFFSFALVLAIPFTSPLYGQAKPTCPVRPSSLAAMRSCYRPLLVFGAKADDPRFTKQKQALDSSADDMMDRNVLFVPVLAHTVGYQAPLDAPSISLPATELQRLRKRYAVNEAQFHVVLLGEDGTSKLVSDVPVSVERLNALIDGMPSRKREMQEPDTN